MRHTLFVTLTIGIVLTVACTNDVEASDYAQDCNVDADCVVVLVGDVCDCDCADDAINRRDESKYDKDRGSCSGGCTPAPECVPCPSRAARCISGRCTAVADNAETESTTTRADGGAEADASSGD
jgi:hypothetical protein